MKNLKRYYSIGEASEMTGVSQSSIRFWESHFFEYGFRRNGKNRKFLYKDIEKIKIIWYLLKVEKYTLEGTQRQLKLNYNKWKKVVKIKF